MNGILLLMVSVDFVFAHFASLYIVLIEWNVNRLHRSYG